MKYLEVLSYGQGGGGLERKRGEREHMQITKESFEGIVEIRNALQGEIMLGLIDMRMVEEGDGGKMWRKPGPGCLHQEWLTL